MLYVELSARAALAASWCLVLAACTATDRTRFGGVDAQAVSAADAAARGGSTSALPKVMVISVDGLRPDAIVEAPAPNLLALIGRGSSSLRATTIVPSLTLPSHASMLTGCLPEAHGLVGWNDVFRLENGYSQVPTIFSAIDTTHRRTIMVVGKDKLQHIAIPGTVDSYVFAGLDDEGIASIALAEIEQGFDLMFLHFPMVDITGHGETWMSAGYLQRVAQTDALIGAILESIPANATVIVTADHGGLDYFHGREIPEDMTIPWIIAGPGIRNGHTVSAPISTTDTAATVLHLFGKRLDDTATGRVVTEAFEN